MFNGKWEEKHGNNLPDQVTRTKGIAGTHVGNMILQSPPRFSDKDFLAGSSMKRNLTGLASSGSTSACSIPRQSNLHDGNSLLGLSGQGNSCGVFINEQKSVEPVSTRHRFDNQFHHRNHLSEMRPTFNANPFGNGIEKIDNASYNLVSQLQPNPAVKMMPVSETHKQTNNVFSQPEAHRSLSSLKSYSTDAENSLVDSNLQELIKFLSTTHGLPLKMPMEMGSSEYLRLVEILQQASVQPNKRLDGLDGRGYSQEKYPGGSIQSGSYSKVGGTNNPPSVETASLGSSASTEQDAISRTRHNGGQSGNLTNCVGKKPESISGCHGEETIKVKEMTVTPSTEKPKLALTEDESSNYSDYQEKVVGHGQKNDRSLGPLKIDEKKLPSEKAARIVAEKLWDGSLQLSSSVTLSAVAFFKSGEKLLGNNWPEQVEVKGKVRLEAFEKYVQDLPRSRNRGLMVISLCWKEGSSETGLTGMKEVSKGYKKSSRVGFAQLSSGIDLYICPRTDTIITILAKYGFFKGMAVIDDKQDSMLGCVVWRKNRSSNSGNTSDSKNSPNLTQPQNSPSASSIKQGAEKELSPTKQTPESSQHIQSVIVPSSADLESSREDDIASKNVVSAEVDHKAGNSSSNSSSLQNPVSFDPCNLVRKRPFEDDDLPEYDFGITTPVSQPINPVIPKNHGLASVKSQRLDNSRLTQIPSIVNRGIHACSGSKTPVYPVLEEKTTVTRNTSNGSFEHSSKRTKLFDEDDDDMPEWCPPVLHNQIPPQTTKSNFNKLPLCPPQPPPIPPPPPADTRLAFSYQPFRPTMNCPTSASVRAPPPPPLPTQRHPSSSVVLNPNHASRHQPRLSNVNPPFPSSNGRRPRP